LKALNFIATQKSNKKLKKKKQRKYNSILFFWQKNQLKKQGDL